MRVLFREVLTYFILAMKNKFQPYMFCLTMVPTKNEVLYVPSAWLIWEERFWNGFIAKVP